MTSSSRDYYAILGVSKDATVEEIDTAFRLLKQQYDLRQNLSEDDTRRLAVIDDAYDTLAHGPFRAAYDKAYATFHEPLDVMDDAMLAALRSLGEVAFNLARNPGAGISDEWTFLNVGTARPPDGLWQATFECTLEEVLKSHSTQNAESAALSAAWALVLDETERAARRQALGARSSSYYHALCFDFALSIVAMTANVLGFRFGRLNLSDRPDSAAWSAVFDVAYETAFREFLQRDPNLSQGGTADSGAYGAVYSEAADKAFQAARPFMSQESFLKVLSLEVEEPKRKSGRGCAAQIIILAAVASGAIAFAFLGLVIA